eukprot:TRINITY_DN170_c0_g1_i1.p1 TRINITY_DN170_c0_g1~~TRINITY_DN170_c0_g1_i1.p1  ORF type:complete len:795 (+),score=199.84 TRINITY_DN170_c0_g1_i1:55-2439(+)
MNEHLSTQNIETSLRMLMNTNTLNYDESWNELKDCFTKIMNNEVELIREISFEEVHRIVFLLVIQQYSHKLFNDLTLFLVDFIEDYFQDNRNNFHNSSALEIMFDFINKYELGMQKIIAVCSQLNTWTTVSNKPSLEDHSKALLIDNILKNSRIYTSIMDDVYGIINDYRNNCGRNLVERLDFLIQLKNFLFSCENARTNALHYFFIQPFLESSELLYRDLAKERKSLDVLDYIAFLTQFLENEKSLVMKVFNDECITVVVELIVENFLSVEILQSMFPIDTLKEFVVLKQFSPLLEVSKIISCVENIHLQTAYLERFEDVFESIFINFYTLCVIDDKSGSENENEDSILFELMPHEVKQKIFNFLEVIPRYTYKKIECVKLTLFMCYLSDLLEHVVSDVFDMSDLAKQTMFACLEKFFKFHFKNTNHEVEEIDLSFIFARVIDCVLRSCYLFTNFNFCEALIESVGKISKFLPNHKIFCLLCLSDFPERLILLKTKFMMNHQDINISEEEFNGIFNLEKKLVNYIFDDSMSENNLKFNNILRDFEIEINNPNLTCFASNPDFYLDQKSSEFKRKFVFSRDIFNNHHICQEYSKTNPLKELSVLPQYSMGIVSINGQKIFVNGFQLIILQVFKENIQIQTLLSIFKCNLLVLGPSIEQLIKVGVLVANTDVLKPKTHLKSNIEPFDTEIVDCVGIFKHDAFKMSHDYQAIVNFLRDDALKAGIIKILKETHPKGLNEADLKEALSDLLNNWLDDSTFSEFDEIIDFLKNKDLLINNKQQGMYYYMSESFNNNYD